MSKTTTLRDRDFKGSRLRCLLATHTSREATARFFDELVGDIASITEEDNWYPQGFIIPDEAKLEKPDFQLLEDERRRTSLMDWWLENHGHANTPNWDLISTCRLGGRRGLLLVEAKAHCGELKDDQCGATNQENYMSIKNALSEASNGLNHLESGFCLDADHWYQISNRFAFAWKLASMGIPAVLVYLGFLNAHEMEGRKILTDSDQWKSCILEKTNSIVPEKVWNRTFHVTGTPLSALIRTADVQVEVKQVNR